eukprot:TRINITY_DN8631_c0_g2_i2.p1 TRINITY_DN8631_c0_g2~~TRINITY_DN8631_c0_g2_i2.p1  ORF type:complete len:543 (+),score=178.90 TRINITY_DN8631_c0_g2_i2:77-1705(+)
MSEVASSHRAPSITKATREFWDDVSALLEPSKHVERPIHISSMVFNLLQSCMGVGILSLAATFQFSGIAGGAMVMIGTGLFSFYTMKLLAVSMVVSGTESYEALGEYCYGRAGQVTVQVTLLGSTVLGLICYLVPLKHYIFDVLRHLLSASAFESFTDHSGSPNLCLGILMLCVILPLSLMRRIDSLWFTSLLGFVIQLYFTLMSLGYFASNADKPLEEVVCSEIHDNVLHGGNASNPSAALNSTGGAAPSLAAAFLHASGISARQVDHPTEAIVLFGLDFAAYCQTASICAASFCCQVTVFPIYREVRRTDSIKTSVAKLKTAAKVAMSIATLIYITAASSGYLMFRDITDQASSILACYDPSDPAVIICYFGMSCVLIFGFPILLLSVRYCLATFFYSHEYLSEGPLKLHVHVLITLGIIGAVTGVALCVDKLTSVIAIGGGIVIPFFGYVLPVLCYVRVMRMHGEDGDPGERARLLEERLAALELCENQSPRSPRCPAENEQYIAELAQAPLTLGYAVGGIGVVVWLLCVYGSIQMAVS